MKLESALQYALRKHRGEILCAIVEAQQAQYRAVYRQRGKRVFIMASESGLDTGKRAVPATWGEDAVNRKLPGGLKPRAQDANKAFTHIAPVWGCTQNPRNIGAVTSTVVIVKRRNISRFG